jgi:hypothetical protein
MATDRPTATSPVWLRAAGILNLSAAAVIFFGDPKGINGVYLAGMALISIAGALGSRIGWSCLLLIAGTIVIEFLLSAQSALSGAVWSGVAIALLTPSSVRFVWRRERQPLIATLPAVGRYWLASRAMLYGFIAWLAQWEAGQLEKGVVLRGSFSILRWRLGYCCAVLFFIYLVAFNVQSADDGGSSGVVDVVVTASRTGFMICLLLFLGVVFVSILARLRGNSHSSKSE